MSDNFFEQLHAAWRDSESNPCLALAFRSLTYGELDRLSAQMAGALREMGAEPGDRILVQVNKSPENVALYLGAMRAGLVYVPLNTAYTKDEVDYFLNDAEPFAFVCTPDKLDTLAQRAYAVGAQHILTLGANGEGSLIDAASAAQPFDDVEARKKDDVAVILYTSGTTGRSKGAMLSHENLSSNAKTLNTLWAFSKGDVLLHALPIFHIHGLFVALHTAMLSAAEILFLPKFDVADVRTNLARATVMMGVPTMYSRLLADPAFTAKECANMRLFISGSAPLTAKTHRAFKERAGHAILERYGMSEAGMIASNPLDGERVAGTVGFALPDVSVRIRDDKGGDVAHGEPGGVEVKGPNVFNGYWKNPQKTEEGFTSDGYFKTGDIGALDDAGRLTLMGRANDLVIAGGYNIYPKEIEQVLEAVPGVKEVAVIGVPHFDMGEGLVAVIVGEPVVETDLQNAIKSLARFKWPRKVLWIDALPRNAMGKVQKQILQEKFKDAFAVTTFHGPVSP